MRVVILAGGHGSRLAPYSTVLPKPLMPIGDMPILEVVLRQLGSCGFSDVTLATGYLAELLMAYCGDGSRFGVRVTYSREESPLGTAGPLALVPDLDQTFLAMNGDLLTTLDYRAMLESHRAAGALATLASHRRKVKVDLGVVEVGEDGRLTRYVEKPSLDYIASMGVYLFEPGILEFIPSDRRLDLPDLMQNLMAAGHPVNVYEHEGFWLDIGNPDDHKRAIAEFAERREMFLPGDA